MDIRGLCILDKYYGSFSRKIIFWMLSDTLKASCVVEAVEKAKTQRNLTQPLVFHNDRKCQLVSEVFCEATTEMINSYSKKAYPWDNACIESFPAWNKELWLLQAEFACYSMEIGHI